MTLLRFEPMRDLDNFQNRFQKFFGELPGFHNFDEDTFLPAIDIKENDKNLALNIEVPGVSKDDLKITLQDNTLTIKGKKKEVSKEKDENIYRSERVFGSFERSFTLPVEVDSDNVDAKVIHGVLEIKLEKVQPKKPKEKVISLN